MAEQLPDWDVEDDERIWRLFEFPDFATALARAHAFFEQSPSLTAVDLAGL